MTHHSPSRRRTLAALALAAGSPSMALAQTAKIRFVEIRTYKCKAGMRSKFLALFDEGASEMLRRHNIRVVGYGPAAHDPDVGFLMRGYASLEERTRQLEGFYGSDEWKARFDERATALLDTYTTLVLEAGDPAVRALLASL